MMILKAGISMVKINRGQTEKALLYGDSHLQLALCHQRVQPSNRNQFNPAAKMSCVNCLKN